MQKESENRNELILRINCLEWADEWADLHSFNNPEEPGVQVIE